MFQTLEKCSKRLKKTQNIVRPPKGASNTIRNVQKCSKRLKKYSKTLETCQKCRNEEVIAGGTSVLSLARPQEARFGALASLRRGFWSWRGLSLEVLVGLEGLVGLEDLTRGFKALRVRFEDLSRSGVAFSRRLPTYASI